MSTQYGLRKSIKADELFDGRLEAFGVREGVRPEGAADRFPPYMKVREVRCPTDGSDSREVVVWQNGYAHLDVRNLWCAPGKEIFHAIAEAFDTDIVTEHQPEYWGFDTQEEWDADNKRIHEEGERKFHAELLKHLRGEPSNIRPGTIGMKNAEIAKALVEKDPSLMEPENRDKLMGEIDAIYDRDYAVKVTLTPEEVADAEVVGIMRSAAALHPERDNRSRAARRPYTPQAAAASIHHRMPLTSAADNPDNHYPTYISDNPERDVASIAVEVGGVVHLGHYSTRNGMIRVTYGSSCKATQLGGMENAPKGLARMILAEQVREALGHNEAED
jgi:hypothetical protein